MLDIIGNLKIDESKPERVDHFIACLRSWAFFKDHCTIRLNLNGCSSELLERVRYEMFAVGFFHNISNLTNEQYGKAYCELLKDTSNPFVLNFIEDHFAVINDVEKMLGLLNYMQDKQVDMLKASFWEVEKKSSQHVKGENTAFGRIFRMNADNHHKYGIPYGFRYMIGVNFLTTRDFALRFWDRTVEDGHRPHGYEIGEFNRAWEHTCMIPSFEVLAAVDDDHGEENSCLLKRDEPKWKQIFESGAQVYQQSPEQQPVVNLDRDAIQEKTAAQPRTFPKDSKFVFNDLRAENAVYDDEIVKRLNDVIYSGVYLFGKQMDEFEASFAKYNNRKYCITVKNCTDAIMLVLGYILRNKPGRTVILPNFGAYPTAVAVKNCTDNIVFVDVDESLTMDVQKLPDMRNGIIIPVHLFGNNANMRGIFKYAHANDHILIEDCAQSCGSGSGSVGDFSVFSFYPTKPLGTMGDGGAICTNDKDAYEELKKMRFYGQNGTAMIEHAGLNSRIGELEAAVLNAKLGTFEQLIDKRRQIASRYKKIITGIRINSNCVYHQFPVLFNEREKMISELQQRGIPYMIHYPHHVSEMPVFAVEPANLKRETNTVGFRVNDKAISLPCHPFMTEQQIQQVEEFLTQNKEYEY